MEAVEILKFKVHIFFWIDKFFKYYIARAVYPRIRMKRIQVAVEIMQKWGEISWKHDSCIFLQVALSRKS